MRKFTLQVLLTVLVAVLGFLVAAGLYWESAFRQDYLDSLTDRLKRETLLVARALPAGLARGPFDRLCRERGASLGVRITVVGPDGEVLCESERDSEGMENHARRPEIESAREDGIGVSVRKSATLGDRWLYVAARDGERLVRLAMPYAAVHPPDRVLRDVFGLGLVVAVVIGSVTAWLVTRRVVARIRHVEEASRRIAEEATPPEEAPLLVRADPIEQIENQLVARALQMRNELAAAEAEREQLEVVLRHMGDGVVVIDGDGRVMMANDSACTLLSVASAKEAVGARLSFLLRNPDLVRLVDQALDGESAQGEIILGTPDAPKAFFVSAAALPGGGGAVLVFHDVTRLRQLETVRADFVANVSHELRTPLTAIRGYAETLRDGALDRPDQAREFLGVIERHAARLARLIDDLLSLSDLELGRTQIRRVPVSLTDRVDAVFEIARPQAQAKEIALVAEIPEDLPDLLGDADRIEEVLINLVDNAIKYGNSRARVLVAARALSDRDAVEIVVADQGIGIPEKDVPRLTERFFRVDRARSRELGGTGLGLAIVKHVVHAHDGQLSIESRINQGTTVRIVLPSVKAARVAHG